ncbi:MAG: class I SAM-dependent methyltransferase [Acidobacteriaceae bacterium]|nr:class I SAM-dependent methyltransferase [Acidobacteriaceae bacterium]
MKFGGAKGGALKASPSSTPITRTSSGLEQFCAPLQKVEGYSILDMSGASQANIGFITGMGHRISSDDVVGSMEECFGKDFIEGQQAAANAQRFLDQALTFPEASFDGALIWDALQFLTSPLLEQTVAQLLRVMRPGGMMLVFFNSDEKASRLAVYNYRIQDAKTLLQVPRGGLTQRGQFFPNRTIERVFAKASSLKFFLTRDSLREVLVRR